MQEATTMQNADDAIQMSNKVSYEICKNNEHVAQLLLPRISFRLGETVTAVFSFAQAALPCYHVRFNYIDFCLFGVKRKNPAILFDQEQRTSCTTKPHLPRRDAFEHMECQKGDNRPANTRHSIARI